MIKDFSEPLKPIFMAIFAWSITNICSSMLLIRTELAVSINSQYHFIDNGILIRLFFQISMLEFGNYNAFEETNDTIGAFSWYLFPISTWKLLPIVIVGAHQPVAFIVCGRITCSRMDFQTVRIWDFGLCKMYRIDKNISIFFQAANSGYSCYVLLGRLR